MDKLYTNEVFGKKTPELVKVGNNYNESQLETMGYRYTMDFGKGMCYKNDIELVVFLQDGDSLHAQFKTPIKKRGLIE